MYEFWRQHTSPFFPKDIDFSDFKRPEFWVVLMKQIPPLIRKLSEYYQIPAEEYPKRVELIFDETRWEKWEAVGGKGLSLNTITGGSYFSILNRIELNPYLYMFEGSEVFLRTLYHELAHWIIEKVDYLKEEKEDGTYHHYDFNMVLSDICKVSERKPWKIYCDFRENHRKYVIPERGIETITVLQYCKSEYYEGQIRPLRSNSRRYFAVDGFPE
jgi:hypothetical protein